MRFVDGGNSVPGFDPSKDVPNLRLIHLDNGRTLRLERKDPYGFVYIGWDHGPTPKEIGGSYTSFERANTALRNWIAGNIFADVTVEPAPKVEPLQYKKKFRDVNGKNVPLNG